MSVSDLPPEILCHIFHFVRANEPGDVDTPPTWVIRATHVCRRWRTAALEFPNLWINPFLSSHPRLPWSLLSAKIHLARAKGARLNVTVFASNDAKGLEFAAVLKGRMHRIKSLTIAARHIVLHAATVLSEPAPILEELNLVSRQGDDETTMFGDLLAGHAPSLTDLAIAHCQLSLSSIRLFTSLRSLRLMKTPSFTEPTIGEYCEMLKALGPKLEVLKFVDCLPTSSSTSPTNGGLGAFSQVKHITVRQQIDPTDIIELPRLRELHLSEADNQEDAWTCLRTAQLTRRIVIPRTAIYYCKIATPPLEDDTGQGNEAINDIDLGIRTLVPASLKASPNGHCMRFETTNDFGVQMSVFFGGDRDASSQNPIAGNYPASSTLALSSNGAGNATSPNANPDVTLILNDEPSFPGNEDASQKILDALEPHATVTHFAALRRGLLLIMLFALWDVRLLSELSFTNFVFPPAMFRVIAAQSPSLRAVKVSGQAVLVFIRALRGIQVQGKTLEELRSVSSIALSDCAFDSTLRLYRERSTSQEAGGDVEADVWRDDLQALVEYLADRADKNAGLEILTLERCTQLAQWDVQKMKGVVKILLWDGAGATGDQKD